MGPKRGKRDYYKRTLQKKTKPGNLDRIAYHEAGHAVMHILLQLKFDTVSLRTVGREAFEMKNGKQRPVNQLFTEGVSWPKERTESVNEDVRAGKLDLRNMLAAMAGSTAEKMIISEIDDELKLGAQGDVQGITACCRIAIQPGVPIENLKVSVAETFIVGALSMQAEELLADNWPAVQSVARALLERKHLTYACRYSVHYPLPRHRS